MASSKITETELLSRIRSEVTDALGYDDTIAEQRQLAMEYYYGLPFGNEVDGRSQFVDRTVMDTIEWIKPSLMRIFASGEEMVIFQPHGPEDVEQAKQATDYVNYVFQKDNPGWEILYSWFTDALLQKNGIVKCWWDESDTWNREEYSNLTDDEFAVLIAQTGVDVLEHTPPGEEQTDDYTSVTTKGHSVVIKRDLSRGRIKVEPVPPDEFLISREAKTIEEARFVCHRVRKTLSELREMYPHKDIEADDLGSGDEDSFSGERFSRYRFDLSADFEQPWGTGVEFEEALQEYWLHESFVRTDYDNDGIAELRKVCTVGDFVLANEEIDRIPFVSLTPIKIPHKFFGLSVADLVMDLQRIKSILMRNLMDNMYSQNFGRYAVLEGQANLDDLLTQRPGGVVRVKSPNAIMPLPTPPLESYSFEMLEYLDSIREARAGVSKPTQGLSADALTSHTTATAVNAVMTAAQSRLELIARNFAETGVKTLMQYIYELLQKNQDKERVVQLRNEWIEVRPDMWRDKMDCTVSVGIGQGNKDQQLMHLSSLMQFASESLSGGLSIVNEQNMYNIGTAMLRNMGFQNVDDYLTNPEDIPPEPEGPSPEEEAAQAELDLKRKELDIKAADIQLKLMKLKQEGAKSAVDAQLKVEELNLEREQNRAVAIGAT